MKLKGLYNTDISQSINNDYIKIAAERKYMNGRKKIQENIENTENTENTENINKTKNTENITNNNKIEFMNIKKEIILNHLNNLKQLFELVQEHDIWNKKLELLVQTTCSAFNIYCEKMQEYEKKLKLKKELLNWQNQYNNIINLCDQKCESIIKQEFDENIKHISNKIVELDIEKITSEYKTAELLFNENYQFLNQMHKCLLILNYCKICNIDVADQFLPCGHIMCKECCSKITNLLNNSKSKCCFCQIEYKEKDVKKIYY